jgi:hypothetical protein
MGKQGVVLEDEIDRATIRRDPDHRSSLNQDFPAVGLFEAGQET